MPPREGRQQAAMQRVRPGDAAAARAQNKKINLHKAFSPVLCL